MPQLDFNTVERSALDVIDANSDHAGLKEHLSGLIVDRREITKTGFYTYLTTQQDLAPLADFTKPGEAVPASGVHMDVDGLIAGLFVVLWFIDGYAHRIEAVTYANEVILVPIEDLEVNSAMRIWPSSP